MGHEINFSKSMINKPIDIQRINYFPYVICYLVFIYLFILFYNNNNNYYYYYYYYKMNGISIYSVHFMIIALIVRLKHQSIFSISGFKFQISNSTTKSQVQRQELNPTVETKVL